MAYEMNDMSGSAFANDKRQSENHPHFKGRVMINGIEYWHSIWKKKTKDGATWLSSSFQIKEGSHGTPIREAPADDFDDEIPF